MAKKKEYGHPEYFAQRFRDYVNSPLHGGGYRAIQRGNRVEFEVSSVKCEITFMFRGRDLYSTLEMKKGANNSKPIDIPANLEADKGMVEKFADIRRSRAGRVSGNYGEGFREYFEWVTAFVKKFYQDLSSK